MRMKSKSSLNRALLLTTILFAPAMLAGAQEAADEPVPADDGGEIVVLGRFIPEPMRETPEVATFLSTQDLERQGDDNAALALTRLTGLSVISDRFVYVRGLGDRYSSALLNGSPLPSPEPLRRQVPLDLFPSNILDGAAVQKTFSPNYPGEFGGGVIDLRTLRQPANAFFTAKLTSGGNTESTDKRGLTYFGEESDWTGVGDGVHSIPNALQAAVDLNLPINEANFSDAALEALGESLINSPVTVIQRDYLDPDFEAELTAGGSVDVGKYNFGFVGAAGYDSSMRTQRALRQDVVGGVLGKSFDVVATNWDVVFNLFGSASAGWEGNEITLTGFLVRSTTKRAQIREGFDLNAGDPDLVEVHDESTGWYERQLASVQLAGEHEFGNLEVSWRTAFAESQREAPHERDLRLFSVSGGPFQYSRDGANTTRYSDLTDEVASAGLDAAYTIPLSEQRDLVLSGGYAYSDTQREYDLLTFAFRNSDQLPTDVQEARPDFLFSPDNIDPARFVLEEATGPNDSYDAELTVQAAYLQARADILPLVNASIGVRYEDAEENVITGNRFGPTAATGAPVSLANAYWLPAATVTWNFAEDLQLRLGYSQTIARPQFRELAVSGYLDPDTDRQYAGNPFLEDSEFKNYDARIEYYFGRGQFVTAGAYYKAIEKPIEEVVIVDPSGSGTLTRFINAPEATLYGAEIEYRTKFDSPFEVPFLEGVAWLIAANYTYTYSEVNGQEELIRSPIPPFALTTAGSLGIEDGTQLQGTPENIANVQLGLETPQTQLTLLIGWVDERILRRGLGSVPSVKERPGTNIDLVYRRDFEVAGAEFTLGLSGRNLLDEQHEEFQSSALGRTEVNTYDRGRSFSVSLGAKF